MIIPESFQRIYETIDSIPTVILFFIASSFLYPLSRFVFPYIKSVTTQALIHLLYGLTLTILLFKGDTIYCIIMTLFTYVGVRYFSVLLCTIISSISLIIALVIVQLRPINWALDITGITMVMFQKAISLSFNISDGREKKSGKKLARQIWDDLSIDYCPSLFMYSAYLFTPYGSFSNPFLEFKPFLFILNSGKRSREEIHDEDKKFALFRYFGAFLWAGFSYVAMSVLNWDTTYGSEWYSKTPFFIRPFVCAILQTILVSRYFPAWWMVESGLYEFGIGHCGIGCIEFDHFTNMSMWDVIISPTSNEFMRRWNHTTHLFWKNYLFTRLLHLGYSKSFANMMVFVCSMMWHGIKFTFLGVLPECFLCMKADEIWNKKFPQNNDTSLLVSFLHHLWVFTSIMYFMCSWYYPDYEHFIFLRKSVYLLPDIVAILIIVICLILPKKKERKNEKVEEKKND